MFYQVFGGFLRRFRREFVIKKKKRQILLSMKIIRKILWFAFILFLACALIAIGYYFAVTKNTALSPEKLLLSEKCVTVFDGNGEEIKNTAALSLRQTVDIEEVPEKTRLAFVDTEDKRFYSHNGFDTRRIVKAVYNNLRSHSFKEGASTISQQLIKNTHLSQEKTIQRKLKEWKLTRQLERSYTKDEILEKYLNTIYFGHNCFGLRAAAEFYFGKTPKELSIADSAVLAGLVRSPNNYSPFKNPESCLKRKAIVLTLMEKNGSITAEEKQIALKEPLPVSATRNEHSIGYLNFVFDELSELAEKHGFTIGGRIEIFTYMDKGLQAETENVMRSVEGCDKSLFVLDNATHGFKACVSSVGNIRRLPGSLIKPLLVYAPALEENLISPATPILDEKVNYGGYSPENFDKCYHGYVSARECVEKSLNIPAVKVLSSLGVSKGAAYLERLGLPVDSTDESLALALGGMKNGYSLQNLVEAYSTLPNGGVLKNCGFISEIRIDGIGVYKKKDGGSRVFTEETAYLMTDMLKSTAKSGTAKKLRDLPFDVAAKTGTVGTEKGNTDAYALSYTARDCIGVWLGNSDNSYIDCTGGGLPCNVLLRLNEYLYDGYCKKKEAIPSFSAPKNVVRVTLDKSSYYDTHTLLLADDLAPVEYRFTELFKKTAIPTKKSDSFTNPAIFTPELTFSDGTVRICFDKRCPSYYQYRIDRYDYATHNTVYFGAFTEYFTDADLPKNKSYVYTVTPLYKGNEGKSITLPSVSTKSDPPALEKKDEILEKNWWEY